MTINQLVWNCLLQNVPQDAEILVFSAAIKDTDGNIICFGIDEYGCLYEKKEERK